MKIAVYTIALNEEQFVERWYESAKEADYLLIADTGSTDGTVALAKSLGINVVEISIKPWRFDDARNASLACLGTLTELRDCNTAETRFILATVTDGNTLYTR